MNVTAIILAAGSSSRMGRDKLSLRYAGSTVLENVIRSVAASRVSRVVVVVRQNAVATTALARALGADVVVNPRPEEGMASSAQRAIARIPAGAGGFLIVLGDQPQIQTDTIDSVIAAAESNEGRIVLPVFESKRGHPALFGARYRDEILSLPKTAGLNQILRRHPDEILEVPVESPAILEDIDTPADYERALRAAEGRGTP